MQPHKFKSAGKSSGGLKTGISSRWGLRSARRPLTVPEQQLSRSSNLPDPLKAEGIQRLMVAPETHELEQLIAEAARHTAVLRQLHERLRTLEQTPQDLSSLDLDVIESDGAEDFRHAFEHWKLRLAILEMISSARQSLGSLPIGEKECVAHARRSLQSPSSRISSTTFKS